MFQFLIALEAGQSIFCMLKNALLDATAVEDKVQSEPNCHLINHFTCIHINFLVRHFAVDLRLVIIYSVDKSSNSASNVSAITCVK